jgi:photosystem II stability/assembly factor-like uncharacterized protein
MASIIHIVLTLAFFAVTSFQLELPYDDFVSWSQAETGSNDHYRVVAPVSSRTVWLVGASGAILRTEDYGENWKEVGPSLVKGEGLEIGDLYAFSAERAFFLTVGYGNKSRIYGTDNGGKYWSTSFINKDPAVSYNCLTFDSSHHGMAAGNSENGSFVLIETFSGGIRFMPSPQMRMPIQLAGEVNLAMSGSCLSAMSGRWYMGSGGTNPGRIFYSQDGRSWGVTKSPIAGGAAGGVTSVGFWNATNGIAVGGIINGSSTTSAWTNDGGLTWNPSKSPGEYRSSVSWVMSDWVRPTWGFAVGPSGSDYTTDNGKTWLKFSNRTLDTIRCVTSIDAEFGCWAAGQNGLVVRLYIDWK